MVVLRPFEPFLHHENDGIQRNYLFYILLKIMYIVFSFGVEEIKYFVLL